MVGISCLFQKRSTPLRSRGRAHPEPHLQSAASPSMPLAQPPVNTGLATIDHHASLRRRIADCLLKNDRNARPGRPMRINCPVDYRTNSDPNDGIGSGVPTGVVAGATGSSLVVVSDERLPVQHRSVQTRTVQFHAEVLVPMPVWSLSNSS